MISNGKPKLSVSAKSEKTESEDIGQDFSCEKFNWLIHLQHVRGEIQVCKDLIINEIERSNGRNEYVFYKQGEIHRDEGKLQEALDSFQMCLKLNPDNGDNLKEVAKCLYDMRRFKLSMEAYMEAERACKSADWQIYYYLGMCLMKLGDIPKAKEYAHLAVKSGKHEICYSLLIKILISEGDLKSAVAVSNAAVESCPDSVNMLTESGLLFLKVGQTQHAFERLSSALALDSSYPRALLGIGFITQKHEEYDVALTKYKIAIHYEADSVALWNNIGMCFSSKQKYVAAISCLKRALWLQPLTWRTLFNLGLTYLSTAQPASAFNFACAAVNLRSDISDCFVLLGATLLELKDSENAAQALKQASRLSPSHAVVALDAALCCEYAGAKEEAIEHFHRFQELAKEGEETPWITQEVIDLAEYLSEKLQNPLPNSESVLKSTYEDEKVDVENSEEQLLKELEDGEYERKLAPDEV